MFDFLQDMDNDIRDALLIQLRNLWTHTSTAIEGNTLTLGEIAFVLEEGLTISGKPKPVGGWKVEPNSTVIVSGDRQIIFEYASPKDVPELMQNWLSLFQKTCKENTASKEDALAAYVCIHISFVRIQKSVVRNT
jgi:Fic family protein